MSPQAPTAPDYSDLAAALQRSNMPQCPAELHGFALGMAIAGVPEPLQVWQNEVYAEFDPDDVLDNETRALLDRLFAAALVDGDAAQQGLTLFLPEGIAVDAKRLGAVRDWCQGFMFGIGLAGAGLDQRLTDDGRELLNDIGEITRVDTGDVENTAENQAALIEIEEYVREGVMLLRSELASTRSPDDATH